MWGSLSGRQPWHFTLRSLLRISFHLSCTEICKVSLRCLWSELVPLKALSLHSTTTALLVEGFQKETLILDWCLNKHIFSCWCFKFKLDYTLPRSKQTVIWLPPLLDNERTHLWANPEPEDLIFASCWQQWGVRRQKIQVGLFLLSQTFPHKLLSWPYLSILSTKCRVGSVVWFPTWWSFQERWWTTFLQLERNLEVSGFVLASHSWIFFSAFTRNA